MTIVTSEHSPIDANRLEGLDADALRQRINYDTRRFVTEQVNLVLCEFSTTGKKDVFTTYYRIGAEWLDEDSVPVVPCVILYPVLAERNDKPFRFTMSQKKPLKRTLKFYKCPIPVPLIKSGTNK